MRIWYTIDCNKDDIDYVEEQLVKQGLPVWTKPAMWKHGVWDDPPVWHWRTWTASSDPKTTTRFAMLFGSNFELKAYTSPDDAEDHDYNEFRLIAKRIAAENMSRDA